jgi:hypothetical protein
VVANLPSETVMELEDRLAVQLRGVGERVEIRVAEKEVNDTLRCVLAAGGEVVSVTRHRVSLESIFLSTVEGGAEGGR